MHTQTLTVRVRVETIDRQRDNSSHDRIQYHYACQVSSSCSLRRLLLYFSYLNIFFATTCVYVWTTRQYSRSEIWRPQVFQRGSFEEYQAPGRSLVEEAVARAHELLANHEVAPLSDEAERTIDAVVARHEAARV